jgi:hypothetical protein
MLLNNLELILNNMKISHTASYFRNLIGIDTILVCFYENLNETSHYPNLSKKDETAGKKIGQWNIKYKEHAGS